MGVGSGGRGSHERLMRTPRDGGDDILGDIMKGGFPFEKCFS